MDEDWIESEMDEYYLNGPRTHYVDPADYSYVDPKTGLTPKQQAWLDYQADMEVYNSNWIGVPLGERTEDPPRWEDYWHEMDPRQAYWQAYWQMKPSEADSKPPVWIVITSSILIVTALVLIAFF